MSETSARSVTRDAPGSAARLTICMHPGLVLSDEEFFQLCRLNRDLRFERTAEGDVIVMSPTGAQSGSRNAEITRQVANWAKRDGAGVVFDSSTGFRLPNGADRSPDTAWLRRERLTPLSPEERRRFLPLCPDFVVELVSPTDALEDLQAKMEEYMANGAGLGWLIDPDRRRVHIYRPGKPTDVLADPAEVSAHPELPGLVLDTAGIWEPGI
ncbi:MAG: Uma2 family endonuclease [Acidobacteriota bacterium]